MLIFFINHIALLRLSSFSTYLFIQLHGIYNGNGYVSNAKYQVKCQFLHFGLGYQVTKIERTICVFCKTYYQKRESFPEENGASVDLIHG